MVGKHGGNCPVRAGTTEEALQVVELPRLVGELKKKGRNTWLFSPFHLPVSTNVSHWPKLQETRGQGSLGNVASCVAKQLGGMKDNGTDDIYIPKQEKKKKKKDNVPLPKDA